MKTLSVVATLITCFLPCGFQGDASSSQRKPAPQIEPANKQKADSGKAPHGAASPGEPATDASDKNAVPPTEHRQSKNVEVTALPPEIAVKQVKDSIDYTIMWCTIILTIVGVVGTIAALKTLGQVKRQADTLEDHKTKFDELAKAANSNAEAAILQVRAMQEQITEMSVQSGILQESVGVAREAANASQASAGAAKLSADIAARVSIPTLVVEKFENGETGAASLEAFLQYPKIKITIRNCGQTAAFLKWWTIIFIAGELPEDPHYTGFAGCGIILEKTIIEPNSSYTIPELSFPHRQQLTLEDAQSVISHQKELNVYGYVCYADIFGNPLRRLKFCETALNLFWGVGGKKPYIDWVDFGYNGYTGTDNLKKSASGRGVEDQPVPSDPNSQSNPQNQN